MKLDDKDEAILAQLKQNARKSIREIAKATEIRPSTVHQRMKRLEASAIIQGYTTTLNYKALGEGFIVFMFVKGSLTKYLDKQIIHQSHIKEVFGITGEYDLLLKLRFKDVDEFNTFVINFREQQKDITSTLTFVATTTIKETL